MANKSFAQNITSRQENRKRFMGGHDVVTTAIVQLSQPYLDRDATIELACNAIEEAGQNGAQLIVFPENYIAGYPYWSPGWNMDLDQFRQSAVDWHDAAILVGSQDTERLGNAAKKADAYVAIGCNEHDPRPESDQIFSSIVFLDPDGKVLGCHRKTMPTFQEKMFWGMGDAQDIKVFETDIGFLGGLICGEHTMTPLKAAMIAQREDFHVSLWHGSYHLAKGPTMVENDAHQDNFIGLPLSRSYAIESGAFVAMACSWLDEQDIPEDLAHKKGEESFRNYRHSNGGSAMITPMGVPMQKPRIGQAAIIYSQCPSWMRKARAAILDSFGHYARPDLVRVMVRDAQSGHWRVAGSAPTRELQAMQDGLAFYADAYDVDPEQLQNVLEVTAIE
ncbi:nitrilase-related carbon-nitrogen hydrolase [Polycladidibacter stylochi]|uniref:nitrilase-related carbon-nitrogen hydrolase n=1 Tax=Polycladidibacter stylochi TaxID=1807766 RepID=UPI000834A30B|nr:nitrilase-related carbon-nitrogen hydrolase [Pseudovibrio stylochi]